MEKPLNDRINDAIKRASELRSRYRAEQDVPPHNAALALELADLLAEKCNENLSDCGSKHLASERALRIVEKHGWPRVDGKSAMSDALEWLSAETDTAGQTYNKAALDRVDLADELPF